MAFKVYFDDECVTDVYDCYLKTYSIEPADVRTISEEIAGVDGSIDATEWLGRPIYENRDGSFEFLFMPDGGWPNVLNRVNAFRNKYHGRSVKIATDDEHGYYIGRLAFGSVSNVKGSAQFSVSAELEPFRYIDRSYYFSETGIIRCKNDGVRPFVVTIVVNDASCTFGTRDAGGKIWVSTTYAAGTTHYIYATAGYDKDFRVTITTGTATVSFTEEKL